MISVDKLNVTFGGIELFGSVTFLLTQKDKVGLAGKNGAGKSTLMKILAGIDQPSSGTLSVPKGTRIGYLPQNMRIADSTTVWEETLKAFDEVLSIDKRIKEINDEITHRTDYESDSYMRLIDDVTELNHRFDLLGGANIEGDLEQTLTGLGFKRSDFQRSTSEFSGGWRMRIELAKILLKKPEVFLLDEPTNHLDIESIEWLETFLKNYNGCVVLVSHDKAFLDNITTRTIELSLGKMYDFRTNYTNYLLQRAEQKEQQMAAYRNQQKMIQDTEEFIERFRYKATKAVQVQSRIKQLDKLDRIEVEQEDLRKINIKFPPAPRSGKEVVQVKNLSKNFGSLNVLNKVDLSLQKGEKIAFVGKNGEGKTTLARVILKQLEYQGECIIGHNVKIGYFAQNQADLFDQSLTVFDTIDKIAVGEIRTKIRDILGAFMFSGEEADKKVSVLSGGERTRLAMVALMLEPYNFLVLDEPTNHLDIKSKELLKEALIAYDGTLLIVSHDREFMDGLVDCVYEFKDKKIRQHLGGISDFLQKLRIESFKELEKKPAKKAADKKAAEAIKKNQERSYEEKKEINKQISKFEKLVEKEENNISDLEEKTEEMDQKLAEMGHVHDQSLFDEYELLKKKLEKAMHDWEKHNEELENWSNKKDW